MAGKKLELDETGRAVAENITRIRTARGLNYTELSKNLMRLHRDITPLAVRRIEEGQRRVDVDDLMAIAAALNVSPAALLMPRATRTDELVQTTAMAEPATAERVWDWVAGEQPLVPYGGPVRERSMGRVRACVLAGLESSGDVRPDVSGSGRGSPPRGPGPCQRSGRTGGARRPWRRLKSTRPLRV